MIAPYTKRVCTQPVVEGKKYHAAHLPKRRNLARKVGVVVEQ